MALLEAHTRSASPAVPVMPMVPRPPTLAPEHASSSDATDKKIKRGQGGKGPEDAEKWEVTRSSQQPSSKKAWTTKAKQKKGHLYQYLKRAWRGTTTQTFPLETLHYDELRGPGSRWRQP